MKRIEDLQLWDVVLTSSRPLGDSSIATIEAELIPSKNGRHVSVFDAQTACAEQVAAVRAETVREALAKMTPKERCGIWFPYCYLCGEALKASPPYCKCQEESEGL